jgi:hypothetical protein
MTGHGKPGKRTGASATLNELDAVSPSPIGSKANRLQREPAQDWRRRIGSHENVQYPLDALRHQRSSGAVKSPGRKQIIADRLILMGVWRDSSQP